MIADSTVPWLPALPPFLLASLVSVVTVPATIWFANRVGAIDDPKDERRIHQIHTPRLGGLALFLGFAVAVAVSNIGIVNRWQIIGICAVTTITLTIDDIVRLPWWAKLAMQIGAGVLVAASGILISFFALPGHSGSSVVNFGLFAAPITVAWIVGLQNSINLLDGSDGVAAGVVAIVAGVSLLAAINRLGPQAGVQHDVIILSGALMGCCTGFLVFNLYPARVFMGDSGSHFLGVALGIITILGFAKIAVGLSLAIPIIALALPISDTAFAVARRGWSRTSIAQPDAGHLHHRLLAHGFSPRETAIAFYLSTAFLGCISLALFGHRKILDAAIVLLAVGLVALFWRNHHRESRGDNHQDDAIIISGHPLLPKHRRKEK